MRTVLAASAAFFAFAVSAHAADAIMSPPPAAPAAPMMSAFTWTGGYLGIQGGYVNTQADTNFIGDDDFDGAIAGIHAGYNWQSGAFVYGIEVDGNYTFNENTYDIGVDVDAGTDWQGSVRGRLGYALDRTLIYTTAGLAITNAYVEVDAIDFDESETYTGYTVGGGVEHAFTDNMTARLEYRYSDFGDENFDLPGLEVDLDQHQVTAGVSFKF